MENEVPVAITKELQIFLDKIFALQGVDSLCTGNHVDIHYDQLPEGVVACIQELSVSLAHPTLGIADSILKIDPYLEVLNSPVQLCDELVNGFDGVAGSACNPQGVDQPLQFFMRGGKVLLEGIDGNIVEVGLDIFLRKFGNAMQETMSTTLPDVARGLYEHFLSTSIPNLCGSVALLALLITFFTLIRKEEEKA